MTYANGGGKLEEDKRPSRRSLLKIAPLAASVLRGEERLTTRKVTVSARGQKVRLISPNLENPVDMRPVGEGRFEADLQLDPRPNVYRYSLEVDGQLQADAANPLMKATGARLEAGNLLWHPESLHGAWLNQRIPRGQLQSLTVRCSYPKPHDRQVWVHVPAGFEGRTKGLPALYLLHAGGGSGFGYVLGSTAPEVADWLIAEKRTRPFVLVMPDSEIPAGYRVPEPGAPSAPLPPGPDRGTSRDPWVVHHLRSVGEGAKSLRDEVFAAVERRFGLRADLQGRAIAGVSGGGTATLLIEAQTAGYAHFLSAAVMHNGLMTEVFFREIDKRPKGANRPKVVAIAGENDGFRNVEFTREFARQAQDRGMLHELTIHRFGHSGGPRFFVQAMEGAYGVGKR